jgi:hypothetical protein
MIAFPWNPDLCITLRLLRGERMRSPILKIPRFHGSAWKWQIRGAASCQVYLRQSLSTSIPGWKPGTRVGDKFSQQKRQKREKREKLVGWFQSQKAD